jgi:hypothetical protein
MSVLERLASSLGRRDEVPNQELARDLAAHADRVGIAEVAAHLTSKDRGVAADCVKVLDEIGQRDAHLIAPFADAFVALLDSKNNRLVWGAMSALSSVATVDARAVFAHRAKIIAAIEGGSVITVDNGIATLARVAAASPGYRRELWPRLAEHLRECRAKELGQHAETIAVAADAARSPEFVALLESRLPELSSAQAARVKRVIKVHAAARPGPQSRASPNSR